MTKGITITTGIRITIKRTMTSGLIAVEKCHRQAWTGP
jgi:hypothetical protein